MESVWVFVCVDIFLSRSYILWLGVLASLLWTMSIWLLMDLPVLAGRQRCFNCSMPLERALLMELLESQSVSAVLSVLNFLAWTCRTDLMMQQTALVLVTPLRRLWPEGTISLPCLFEAVWCQTGIRQRWPFMLMSAGSVFVFVAWLVLWNNAYDEIWQPCTQTVTETNFSDCDNLIQTGCAENLFWCSALQKSLNGNRAFLLMPLKTLLYSSKVAQ